MEQTLIENLTQLTHVTEATLEKFIPITEYIVGHAVHESMCRDEELTTIDIGIGLLHIRVIGDEVRYKFNPSKNLCTVVEKTVVTRSSPIIQKVSSDIQEKINRSYRELL